MEFCKKCKQSRTIEDFFLKPDGSLRRPCKICIRLRQQKHNIKNKEKDRSRYLKEKDKRRNDALIRTYGINQAEYDRLLETQNNCCALCFLPFKVKTKRPHIDHCHTTGKVRGIVHSQCNILLGFANDNVQLLQQAINYLKICQNQ